VEYLAAVHQPVGRWRRRILDRNERGEVIEMAVDDFIWSLRTKRWRQHDKRMSMGLDASGPDLSAFAVVPIVQMPPIAASAHNKPRSSVHALRIGCQSVRFGTACVNVRLRASAMQPRPMASELHGQLL
jgi:hypothetical protein